MIVLRGNLLMNSTHVVRYLQRICEIAASNKSNDEKVNDFLSAPELGIVPRDEAEMFVAGFRDSPSLKKRITELVAKQGRMVK